MAVNCWVELIISVVGDIGTTAMEYNVGIGGEVGTEEGIDDMVVVVTEGEETNELIRFRLDVVQDEVTRIISKTEIIATKHPIENSLFIRTPTFKRIVVLV